MMSFCHHSIVFLIVVCSFIGNEILFEANPPKKSPVTEKKEVQKSNPGNAAPRKDGIVSNLTDAAGYATGRIQLEAGQKAKQKVKNISNQRNDDIQNMLNEINQ